MCRTNQGVIIAETIMKLLNAPMKSIVIQKSANREVRIGWQDLPAPKRQKGDTQSIKGLTKYANAVATTETEVVRVGDRAYLIDKVNGCSVLASNEADCHEALQSRSLDIISDFQRSKVRQDDTPKSGWGNDPKVTRFGSYARHTILEAGAIASRGTGHLGRGVEVTLTLPSTSHGAFRALSQWSGYAVNRILQAIRRNSADIEWFYVWEVQKRGALHLHMALSGASREELLRVGRKVRKAWFRVLEDVGRKSGANMFLRRGGRGNNTYKEFLKGNRVAEIRKSLAAYFAKYVSKGAATDSKGKVVHWYPPSRWWGISRKLLKKVKEERLNVRITNLSEEQCVELLSMAEAFVRRHSPIRSTGYNFELSYGNGSNARPVGIGARWLYWFSDESFDKIQVWLPQFIRFLSKYCIHACSNAVIEGTTSWKAG